MYLTLKNPIKILKNICGIKDISLFKKRMSKRIGKYFYKEKYTVDNIIGVMEEMGMHKGSVVCIHSSMMQFYNFQGTANDLIEKIISVIGEEGTLMMPAFPDRKGKNFNEFIFDPKTDITGAGYLAETFRRREGVLRSNNVQHSVCAIGRYAEYLIKDHTMGDDCWDKNSPFYRLTELNGLVFNLGLPRNYMGTFHHCVESLLKKEHPYWGQFFNTKQTFRYRNSDGEIEEYQGLIGKGIIRKTRKKRVYKYFGVNEWRIKKISNLEIKVFYAKHALNKMLDLGRRGVSVYNIPSTRNYQF